MFLDAMTVQGKGHVGHGKVRGPKCSAGPGAFPSAFSHPCNFTPLLITVVARRSPKGIQQEAPQVIVVEKKAETRQCL